MLHFNLDCMQSKMCTYLTLPHLSQSNIINRRKLSAVSNCYYEITSCVLVVMRKTIVMIVQRRDAYIIYTNNGGGKLLFTLTARPLLMYWEMSRRMEKQVAGYNEYPFRELDTKTDQ